MKKIVTIIALAVAFLSTTAVSAQNTIKIKADKSTRPLVEKWAEAYKSVTPNVNIEIVSGKNAQADLTLVTSAIDEDNVTYVGRYALLPVTSAANPLIDDIQKREWKAKDIKSLFFVADEFEDYDESKSKKDRLSEQLTVYSGNSSTSSASVFAANFDHSASDLRGKKIVGDDVFLINAINSDKQSVTFSRLSNIYDLETRTLRSDLALFPLNVKKNLSEALVNGTLDDVLKVVESQKNDLVVVSDFGFIFTSVNATADAFLSWVVSDGQAYNNEKGFLRLSDKQAQAQLSTIAARHKKDSSKLLARSSN